MAARFPALLLSSSLNFSQTPLHPIPQRFNLYSNPTRKRFTLCAAAAKKRRADRKIMTDEELCRDIREFSFLHGFPEGHVPSMKELSAHGRKDLANIVRRRGYKLVGELIKSMDMKAEGAIQDEQHLGPQIEISQASIGQDENMHDEAGTAQFEKTEVASGKSRGMPTSMDPGPSFSNQINASSDSTSKINLMLQEKVSNFVQTGVLDIFEDELQNDDADRKQVECIKFEGSTEITFSTSSETDIDEESDERNGSALANGWALKAKSFTAPMKKDELRDENLVPKEMRGMVNQDEINNLEFELHQKELELSKLKEQIEKEKLVLSHMQAKAEAEINKALKLVAEKDTELSTVEEYLSGLKEVQIQYKGEGSTVEVAGSFNGWHHQIKMELQSSDTLQDSTDSRKHRIWSTRLWLYPGVYEVKFIVDGHWRVDPHSESITRGTIHNNILRVER